MHPCLPPQPKAIDRRIWCPTISKRTRLIDLPNFQPQGARHLGMGRFRCGPSVTLAHGALTQTPQPFFRRAKRRDQMTSQIHRSMLQHRESTLSITTPCWRRLEARLLDRIGGIARLCSPSRSTRAAVVLLLRPPKYSPNSTSSYCLPRLPSTQISCRRTSAGWIRQTPPNEHAKFVVDANRGMKPGG